jgi:hypothetical protein
MNVSQKNNVIKIKKLWNFRYVFMQYADLLSNYVKNYFQ